MTEKKTNLEQTDGGLFLDVELTIKIVPGKDEGTNETTMSTKGRNSLLEVLTALEISKKTLDKHIKQEIEKNDITTEKELRLLLNKPYF
jgi:arginine decarboxylase-like protein